MGIDALIVDDEPDILFLIEMFIRGSNAGVRMAGSASNGPEALALIEALDPMVVVLDQMMPGMSGLEVAEEIRRSRPDQLMILCSAYLDEQLRIAAREAGIDECIDKEQVHRIAEAIKSVAGRHAR